MVFETYYVYTYYYVLGILTSAGGEAINTEDVPWSTTAGVGARCVVTHVGTGVIVSQCTLINV